jgi:hypothetical protein
MDEDMSPRTKERLALSIMSGRIKPEEIAPFQWEVILGLGYHRPSPDAILQRCEEIIFDAIDGGKDVL